MNSDKFTKNANNNLAGEKSSAKKPSSASANDPHNPNDPAYRQNQPYAKSPKE